LQERLPNQAVYHSRDAKLSHPTSRFGNLYDPYR
jgi:hypothetical protein